MKYCLSVFPEIDARLAGARVSDCDGFRWDALPHCSVPSEVCVMPAMIEILRRMAAARG